MSMSATRRYTMQPVQGQGQGHETFKVRNSSIFKVSSAVYNGSLQMTMILKQGDNI